MCVYPLASKRIIKIGSRDIELSIGPFVRTGQNIEKNNYQSPFNQAKVLRKQT